MLYQVATAGLAPSDIASPIRSILRTSRTSKCCWAKSRACDAERRQVALADGSTHDYDYLILATGARHSYFGHDEWEPLAPGLKSLEDAEEIRRRVLLAFERAERETDPVRRHAHLTFVVVGGGPTGVEVAGALAEIRRYALRRDFRHIDPARSHGHAARRRPAASAELPAELSERAKHELRRLGVEVREETMVTDIRPGYVVAGGWTIPTQTVVWAAGNVGQPAHPHPRVSLSIGPAASSSSPTAPSRDIPKSSSWATRPPFRDDRLGILPGVCPVAIQMGQYAARTIVGDLASRPRRPFSYWDKGQLAVIGRGHAVADIWRFRFGGLLAWLIWIFVHIFFLIGFRNRVMVLLEWAWAYFTYQRGARLITWPWRAGAVRAPIGITGNTAEHQIPEGIPGSP